MFLKFVSKAKILLLPLLLVFLGLFCSWRLISNDINHLELPLLGGVNQDVRINLQGDAKVFINDKEIDKMPNADFNSYSVYGVDNYPVYSIKVEGENLKNSVVSIGSKLYFFKNGGFSVVDKYLKHGKNLTDKGFFKNLQVKSLLIFYGNLKYSLPSFLVFLILIVCYLKNKTFSSCLSNIKGYLIWLILIYALFIRLGDLGASFWTDEIYSAYMAGNINLPFLSVFSDPGNPPLFFILVKIFEYIFGFNITGLKLLPLIFSFVCVYLIFLYCKKNINTETALISSFLFSVNIYAVVSAQELRCYSLLAFLSILMSCVFMALVKNPTDKKFIAYAILCAISFNTHYFSALIILSNFILGIILIKNYRMKFLISNLFGFLLFFPYLVITGLQKGLLDKTFNLIAFPDFNFYINLVKYYFHGIFPLFVAFVCALFVWKKKNKDGFQYFYMFYMIFSVFLSSFVFSFIKPIAQDWYFICLLPYFIILYSMTVYFLFNSHKKLLMILSLFMFWFLPFHDFSYIKRDRSRLLNFDNLVEVYENLKDKNSALFIPHSKEMLNLKYGINKNEMIVCQNPQTTQCLMENIEKSDAKTFFIRLEYKIMRDFFAQALKKYNISFIRLDKDVIIVELKKN